MRPIGRYQVIGQRAYRGHEPGTVFEARLDVSAERRAIYRGAIRLLDRLVPDLVPGSYRLPRARGETDG